MKKLLFLLIIPFVLISQVEDRKYCGASQILEEALKDPKKKQILEQLEIFTKDFIATLDKETRGGAYIIPVVVHIIHNYGVENISYEQIDNGIFRMNEDFNAENDDLSEVISEFQTIIGNVNMRFRLASKDPDGNCTYGVTRTGSSLTQGGSVEEIMSLVNWPSDQYVNIYVVTSFPEWGSQFAAFATYPAGGSEEYGDYIFCRYDYFGDWNMFSNIGPTGNNWGRHTMSHEMGHFFNLKHPWGGTNEPALDENCELDDGVEDTPKTIGTSNACPLNQSTCDGSLDNVQNIMEYSSCGHMFTEGQKWRMIAAANSLVGNRFDLWQEDNLELTGTDDNSFNSEPYAECAPEPDFNSVINLLCQGEQILFNNYTYNYRNTDIDYLWSFPGGTPSESTDESPTVEYNNPGTYDVSLTACNDNFCETLTMENYINIFSQVNVPEPYFVQDFEDSDFPNMTNSTWFLQEDSEQQSWEMTNFASSEGSNSLRILSQNYGARSSYSFLTPEMNLSIFNGISNNSDPCQICFDYAYAKRLPYSFIDFQFSDGVLEVDGEWSAHHDDLIVSYKTCGNTWIERPRLSTRPGFSGPFLGFQESLFTTNNTVAWWSPFIPQPNEWKQYCISIQNLIVGGGDATSAIFNFEFVGGGESYIYSDFGGNCESSWWDNIGGNWLYLDNIQIGLRSEINQNYNGTGCEGGYDECGFCGDGPEDYYDCDGLCINDFDCDYVCDELDNCPNDYNYFQEDSDSDGIGDACDATPLSVEHFDNYRTLITTIDILGRETTNNKGFQLHIYDDGSVEKKYLIK